MGSKPRIPRTPRDLPSFPELVLQKTADDALPWGQYRKRPLVVRAYCTRLPVNILTLEGTMRAVPGDWIIEGVKGELYPCKPDIFEASYEAVPPSAMAELEEQDGAGWKPSDFPPELRAMFSEMAFWLEKATDPFKPPDVLLDTAKWVALSLLAFAHGHRAPWPEDPWLAGPPADDALAKLLENEGRRDV